MGVGLEDQRDPGALEERARVLAGRFVTTGRIVPGLSIEDGRARSWWWPLPSADDRALLGALLARDDVEEHCAVATALQDLVDAEARARLVAARVRLVSPRRGRRSATDAWLASLTSDDPWLSPSVPMRQVQDLATRLQGWVRRGLPAAGPTRLCLRVHEPFLGDEWRIELLLQAVDEPSLIVPAAAVWSGDDVPELGAEPVEQLLTGLGHAVRVAPELEPLLDEARPVALEVDSGTVLGIIAERATALGEAGIGLLLPTWWTRRGRVGLRARASTRRRSLGSSATTAGDVGMEAIVDFRWEAAIGEERLTAADRAALEAAAAAKQHLVQVRGQWVELRPAELRAVLGAAGQRSQATVAELLRAGMGLDDLDAPDGVDVTGVVASGWLGDLLDSALHTRVAPMPTPAGFVGELRPYQERGVGWLAFLGRVGLGACLADDMGLGKTAQLLATLLAEPVDGPTLVVCPVSVLGNWQREAAQFTPALRVLAHHGADRFSGHDQPFVERALGHDLVLTSYSLVVRDQAELAEVDWGRLVLDEAQQVKNPATAQAGAVRAIPARRRIAMTGTPVENRLSDLWSLMHILNPGLLGSARGFRARFAVPIERDGDPEATELLRRVTGPFVLRRLKSDRSIISDLPDKVEMTDRCLLTREQATLYQAVVDDLLRDADEAEGIDRRGRVLAGLMRLKQVCNHPAHYLGDGSALQGRSGKLTRVEELLEEILADGDRALCFTQFAEWGHLLQAYLRRRLGREPIWLHGGVSRTKRDQMVQQFHESDGPPIFLISLKAGGTGLNLTAASHVIHLDRWWNPAVEDQATDRAYRIGQRRTVLVHKLVCTGTVEERIDEMITRKRQLAERVVGTGEDWLTSLSTDELRDLVVLAADAVEAD
ncbi:MAG TPA: DEAD/DEAH box helicase [Acidimicrobiales bacterium]|nr:DEAD/DEAH box helicase [Acidimicrobiales bacterium]